MDMFKNYIFDLYGTLIDINTDESKKALWDKVALLYCYKQAYYTGKELRNDYIKYVEQEKDKVRKKHPEYEYIDIQIEKVFRKLFTAKKVSVSRSYIKTVATAFRSYSTKYIKLYDGVTDLLDTLKAKGKKVYLLSNAQREFTMNELDMFGLVPYFDGILISSDVQCSKPDIAFYQNLLCQYDIDPEESIMIGNDWLADIKGAKKAGLKSLYIHQNISPEIQGELESDYTIMDGNVREIKKLIIK